MRPVPLGPKASTRESKIKSLEWCGKNSLICDTKETQAPARTNTSVRTYSFACVRYNNNEWSTTCARFPHLPGTKCPSKVFRDRQTMAKRTTQVFGDNFPASNNSPAPAHGCAHAVFLIPCLSAWPNGMTKKTQTQPANPINSKKKHKTTTTTKKNIFII